MTPVDLALAAGAALTAGWAAYLLRRRGAARRLVRLTRAAVPTEPSTRGYFTPDRSPAPNPGRRGSLGRRAGRALLRRPVLTTAAVVALLAGPALALSGPVAALVAALYALMALVALRRRLVRREAEQRVAALLDALDTTTEELRAGIIPDGAAAARGVRGASPTRPTRPARQAEAAAEVAGARLDAACRLSEDLGVPLADLLDRVDADLRSGQALRIAVAAQLSAAQATTVVLLAFRWPACGWAPPSAPIRRGNCSTPRWAPPAPSSR
ncbi:hypothetical protein AB0M46_47180 [Dactylosporangium sp. NPDC051485]|uniref:hypothetical protein n=1 Tax=Dactylosporangium sp. NPDC051485 TaxID=3154846 RepID=UPI003429CB95